MSELHGRRDLRAVDVLYFLAELAVYASAAAAAWRMSPWLAPVAVLALALWWGLLHSPRARFRLPRWVDLYLRVAWFGTGLTCLVWLLLKR